MARLVGSPSLLKMGKGFAYQIERAAYKHRGEARPARYNGQRGFEIRQRLRKRRMYGRSGRYVVHRRR